MARFSRAQYELLTEALGHGLSELRKRDSPMLEDAGMTIIRKLSSELKYDNANFDEQLFVENIRAVADLDDLVDKGIH